MEEKLLELNNVKKVFETPEDEEVVALDDMNLNLDEGEFACIVGPSGCGKSTTLHLVAGFLQPTEGTVKIKGEPVKEPSSSRSVVFQQTESLFNWKTCIENVKFGPLSTGATEEEARQKAEKHLNLVGLDGFEDHYPDQLSGGMKQRLNLARALANEPEILLLDEPFGALDAQTKTILQEALTKIWAQTRQTVLFVTHDVGEAVYLSQRVIVMTARPGSVKSRFNIDFDYPREFNIRESNKFNDIQNNILESIRDETVTASQQQLESI